MRIYVHLPRGRRSAHSAEALSKPQWALLLPQKDLFGFQDLGGGVFLQTSRFKGFGLGCLRERVGWAAIAFMSLRPWSPILLG